MLINTNKANQPQEPDKVIPQDDKVNKFNALMGTSFLCNVCNEHHHKVNSNSVTSCLRNIFYKGGAKNSFDVDFPNPLVKMNCRFQSGGYTSIWWVEFSTCFHPIKILGELNQHANIDIKLVPRLRYILASNNIAEETLKMPYKLPLYQELKDNMIRLIEQVKQSNFCFTPELLQENKIDISEKNITIKTANYHKYIQASDIFEYYLAGYNFRDIRDNIELKYKIHKGDLYAFAYSIKDNNLPGTLLRISLKYKFMPRIGLWKDMKQALESAANFSWQIIETYKYD